MKTHLSDPGQPDNGIFSGCLYEFEAHKWVSIHVCLPLELTHLVVVRQVVEEAVVGDGNLGEACVGYPSYADALVASRFEPRDNRVVPVSHGAFDCSIDMGNKRFGIGAPECLKYIVVEDGWMQDPVWNTCYPYPSREEAEAGVLARGVSFHVHVVDQAPLEI